MPWFQVICVKSMLRECSPTDSSLAVIACLLALTRVIRTRSSYPGTGAWKKHPEAIHSMPPLANLNTHSYDYIPLPHQHPIMELVCQMGRSIPVSAVAVREDHLASGMSFDIKSVRIQVLKTLPVDVSMELLEFNLTAVARCGSIEFVWTLINPQTAIDIISEYRGTTPNEPFSICFPDPFLSQAHALILTCQRNKPPTWRPPIYTTCGACHMQNSGKMLYYVADIARKKNAVLFMIPRR